jgi:DNA-binding transcriptional regulator YhcF (GntR family)
LRAGRELERDGLVVTRGRNGTVVASGGGEGLAAAREAASE